MPAGFRITADPRTNSIIARGNEKRLERLRSAISMLDGSDVGPGTGMQTVPCDDSLQEWHASGWSSCLPGLPAAKAAFLRAFGRLQPDHNRW